MSFINRLLVALTLGLFSHSIADTLDPSVHFEGKRFASPKSERNRNFSKPSSLLGLPGNKTLVSDSKRRNIQLFDKQWSLELQFKPSSSIEKISSMCFGGDNKILALDAPNHRILMFNINGNQSREYGSKGTGRKEFLYPRAISCNVDQATFYVSDTGNLRVQEWTTAGDLRKSFLYVNPKMATLAAPSAVAISNRSLGVIYPELPALVIFHRDSGREKSSIDLSKYAASNDQLQLRSGPKGHWFLLNISRNELHILSPSGVSIHKLVAKKNLLSPIAHIGYMDLDIYGGLRLLDKQNQRVWHFPARAEFQTLQEAQNHVKKGEYVEALNRYKAVIELDPTNSEALAEIIDLYLILSAVAMQEKRHDQAQKLLRELLEIEPSNKIAVTRMRLLLIDEHRDWFTLIFGGLSLIFGSLFLIPQLLKWFSNNNSDLDDEESMLAVEENSIDTHIDSTKINTEHIDQNLDQESKEKQSDDPNIESKSEQSTSTSNTQEINP